MAGQRLSRAAADWRPLEIVAEARELLLRSAADCRQLSKVAPLARGLRNLANWPPAAELLSIDLVLEHPPNARHRSEATNRGAGDLRLGVSHPLNLSRVLSSGQTEARRRAASAPELIGVSATRPLIAARHRCGPAESCDQCGPDCGACAPQNRQLLGSLGGGQLPAVPWPATCCALAGACAKLDWRQFFPTGFAQVLRCRKLNELRLFKK